MLTNKRYKIYEELAKIYNDLKPISQPGVSHYNMREDDAYAKKVVDDVNRLHRHILRPREVTMLDAVIEAGFDLRPRFDNMPAWNDPHRCPVVQYSEGYHDEPDRYYACKLRAPHEGRHVTRIGDLTADYENRFTPKVAVTVVVDEDVASTFAEAINEHVITPITPTMKWVVGNTEVRF